METIHVALYSISFLLIWQFVGYPLIMGLLSLRSKAEETSDLYQPFVSILVATYNEEVVIENRINNLFELDYPNSNYEILVIDSNSTDNTASITKSIIRKSNSESKNCSLKLIEEKTRKGKASAINLGKKYANGDIILVTDANSTFDEFVLQKLVKHFQDPNIGAVSGRYIVDNPNKNITSSEAFYWSIESMILRGESFLDSISTVIGTISAWRKDLINFKTDTLTEDLDMTIRIRKQGYKIVYEPNACVYEPSATTTKDQITQRKRISIGTIQNILKHITYFAIPHNYHSFFIFPSHKILPMISPFLLIAIPLLYLIEGNIKFIGIHLVISTFVFAFILYILLYIKSKIISATEDTKNEFSYKKIPAIIYYVLMNEYLILIAWKDVVFKRYTVLWDKADSTRLTNE